ncbi:LytTR family two component transcriptional regulator [Neolewinella xylanilytica]|uniref:LytTR family two component transcriptional regulator n=1 Tax=Neolewinella xylanilytica TaxID=1514080 RepID=A0A2S6I361_9BACT|nr:LytTR family DNA-binding domain-containing protein [Neolewinella xylanilytica]PPK85618.1 LytTR family two component transcriptional regulator [Neolewinella xylanilytica]
MLPLSCWILEDEPPALRRLEQVLAEVSPATRITFTTDSLAPARAALNERPHPALIFSDIQLADGVSLDLWESAPCQCPIIFTTAYDQYSIRAFRTNGIDYLLKPVSGEDLYRALEKLGRLQATPPPDWRALSELLIPPKKAYRTRILARYRQDWVPVSVEDLRQIYSSDGITFGVSADGKRYLLEESLDRLAEALDPARWFRINRSQIVHILGVRKLSTYFNHRLVLELDSEGGGDNIVSRQRVKDCKEWLGN